MVLAQVDPDEEAARAGAGATEGEGAGVEEASAPAEGAWGDKEQMSGVITAGQVEAAAGAERDAGGLAADADGDEPDEI
eukprot:1183902-Prorocentrum_minimum.AAC.3